MRRIEKLERNPKELKCSRSGRLNGVGTEFFPRNLVFIWYAINDQVPGRQDRDYISRLALIPKVLSTPNLRDKPEDESELGE